MRREVPGDGRRFSGTRERPTGPPPKRVRIRKLPRHRRSRRAPIPGIQIQGREGWRVEIHRADPSARRSAIAIVIVAGIVGAAILHVLGRSSEGLRVWVERDPQRAGATLLALVALGFSAPLLGLAWWIRRFAVKVNRAGRYPPPDARLTRDTRVRTGNAAGAIARLHYILAGFMALLAIGVPVLLWRVYEVLFGS